MSRWKGLLWKEWVLARPGMALLVIATVLSIGVAPFLLQRYVVPDFPVMNIAAIIMGLWMVALSYMPAVSLVISLTTDMKRPDIWLHSPVPTSVLIGAKAFFAVLMTAVSMLLVFGVLALANLFILIFSGSSGLPESVPAGWFVGFLAEIGSVSLFLGMIQMGLVILFWTIYQWMKKANRVIAIVITGAMLIGTLYIWDKITTWGPYQKLAGYGEVPFRYSEKLNRINDWALDITGVVTASGMLLAVIETVFCVLLAIYIFNRKVAR
ncbi:hypothetical protein SAMN04488126_10151 [Bhargavaea beijingensis]|uniref:ABC-2 type transport system permease protein n=1 Tax=Bhargavaea beijingensis TaxID=426756 RepID=A0A1G6XJ08_9BACL|nr:hypothetical protein [Bhargavaea beijingensis]SDD77287.1 hypothetical protein SAMN04488126_10151 [Bhargavaea beijingensis]